MTKKMPSLLISLAVVWASVGQVPAALAQANVEGRVVAAPTIGAPISPALATPAIPMGAETPAIPSLGQSVIPQAGAAAAGIAAAASADASAPAALAVDAAKVSPFVAGYAKYAREQGRALTPEGAAALGRLEQAVRANTHSHETPAAPRTTMAKLASAVARALPGLGLFDGGKSRGGLGILPLPKPTLPQGLDLDDAPAAPQPKKVGGVELNAFDMPSMPAARNAGGVFDAGPRVLNANPASEADVERALRQLVDQDAAKYGVSSAELSTVHVRRIAGKGDQADTIYAYFRQQKQGTNPDGSPYHVAVHGTYLSFTVKVVNGKPVLMAAMAKLYPTLNVDTRQRKTDDELKTAAEARLGIPPNSGIQLEYVERKIIYSNGAWHTANLYVIDGLPFMIAIDIATGEAFAWDSRMGVTKGGAPDAPEAAPQTPAAAPKTAADELPNLKLAQQAAGNLPLVAASSNLLNKSNVWAYIFYSQETGEAVQVLVDFTGRTRVARRVVGPQAVEPLDLAKLKPLSQALAEARAAGIEPQQVVLGRGTKDGKMKYVFVEGDEVVEIEGEAGAAAPAPAPGNTQQPEADMPAPADNGPQSAITGTAYARAEKNDERPNGQPAPVELALPHLDVSVGGKTAQTDVNGNWSSTASGETKFNAQLSGQWVKIIDQARQPVTVSVSVKPGDVNKIVFNPTGADFFTLDQVNTYISITRIHDWWSERLGKDKRIDKQIPANVNIDDECNAYYTPGRPSLNFFRESVNCSDTGRPGVTAHEYGHFVDDMIGGITNGGMSEGWGDIGSMFMYNSRWIGPGFIKDASRAPYPNGAIRDGENTYQYNEQDEVHDQGQAWMGFAWKLRKALIASLGDAAGTAEAEALIIPTLFAKADDIPKQMAQVLLNAMDKSGNIRHEKEIRAAAKAHGITLPSNPGVVATLWAGFTSPLRAVKTGTAVAQLEPPASNGSGITSLLTATAGLDEVLAKPEAEQVKAQLTFTAGRLARKQVVEALTKYCAYHGVRYVLWQSGGVLSSDFQLTVEGPKDKVAYLWAQIQGWSAQS